MSGTLGPINAKILDAWYDSLTHRLCLRAEGEVQPETFDIHFKRERWYGGLKFTLVGRTYAVMGPPQSFDIINHFTMARPRVSDVIVVTADDPHGKIAPIHFVVPNAPPSPPEGGKEVSALASAEGKGPQALIVNDEDIHTIAGHTFQIKRGAEVDDQHGSIHEDHDDNFVELQTSGIQGKDIVWTFKAKRITENTPIHLWISSTHFVYPEVYNVHIGLGGEVITSQVNDHTKSLGTSGDDKAPNSGLVEPFIIFVMVGLDIVKKDYPAAQIHRVTAKPAFPMECISTFQLVNLTLTCEIGDRNLAKLTSKTWGEWNSYFITTKLMDDVAPTPWTDHMMDAIEADKLMKAAGLKGPYTSMDLEKPAMPLKTPSGGTFPSQPYYIFEMVVIPGGPSEVYVGLDDKKVYPYGQALPPLSPGGAKQNGKT